MTEQAAASREGGLRIPASAHEFWALGLAVLVVFVLIQIGAPIVREIEFLDPKLRDYFIGVGFVAFPYIHGQCKRGLANFTPQAAVLNLDLTPWYVSGAFTAALLFAWTQFVSLCALFAIDVLHSLVPLGEVTQEEYGVAVVVSVTFIALPMAAVAAVFAGIMLNRYTRSHVFLALACATFMYMGVNLTFTYLMQPEFLELQFAQAAAAGPDGYMRLVLGMSFVAVVLLVFGAIGIGISRFNRERSLGRIVDGARKLPPAERELLAADISQRLSGVAQKAAAPIVLAVSDAAPVLQPGPTQLATAAEP